MRSHQAPLFIKRIYDFLPAERERSSLRGSAFVSGPPVAASAAPVLSVFHKRASGPGGAFTFVLDSRRRLPPLSSLGLWSRPVFLCLARPDLDGTTYRTSPPLPGPRDRSHAGQNTRAKKPCPCTRLRTAKNLHSGSGLGARNSPACAHVDSPCAKDRCQKLN
ncbi:hypothetical protein K0M31_004492 [Melipona bicolor]|uniref:Uncharacterized protein n=1 Tax=Melipona bicolor TaxID=60889 RepID=A0AA40FXC9_9HYME|nr:hypothetical protein K0M31_004492 [Melipona bicolor]